jgi:NADPH:quinone reductase-like Zn-dependent oxidoreductase
MKIVTGKTFPRAMGMDFSGIVTIVGSGVSRFKVGDAVFGLAKFKESGAFAQAVVTKDIFLAKKPDNVSFEDAACLGTPGVTVWNGLIDKAKLGPGQYVFINGCVVLHLTARMRQFGFRLADNLRFAAKRISN